MRVIFLRVISLIGIGTVSLTLSLTVSLIGCGDSPTAYPTSPHRAFPALDLPAAPRTLHYRIDARLLDRSRRLRGTLELHLKNISQRPLKVLLFHLYLNAFASEHTHWMKTARDRFRSGTISRASRGWIRIEETLVRGVPAKHELLDDGTILRVTLPEAIPIQSDRNLTLRFEAQLPRLIARTGHAGEFFMIAQWYPKLGFLRPDGSWHCPPFHANSEFFARFADYDVTLTVPSRYQVGATGQLIERSLSSTGVRLHYRAHVVHDFALAAWPHFTETRVQHGSIQLRLLSVPGRSHQNAALLRLIERASDQLQAWLGRYPYPELTIIDVPTLARGAMGMEYPTLFTTWLPAWAPPGVHALAELAVHELTHQYFQGIVATNEAAEPWLDEGLTTFVSGIVLDQIFGRSRSLIDFGSITLGQWQKNALHQLEQAQPLPVAHPADTFSTWRAYAATVYGRAAALFYTLDDLIGRDRMIAALRSYVRDQAFKHPEGQTLRETLLAHSSGRRQQVVVKLLHAVLDESQHLDDQLSCATGRITFERRGEIALPIEIHARTHHGAVFSRSVSPLERQLELEVPGLTEAWLGPPIRFALDTNPLDNRCSTKPLRQALTAPLSRLQQLMPWILP